ncbi:hypothetical protein, partial [Streptomyces pseudogriseolus]|uniref:hypothetical protein n=1 Tax=Streptomyces pseudogriseolus TaxID=36817 RepID=UPI00347795E1
MSGAPPSGDGDGARTSFQRRTSAGRSGRRFSRSWSRPATIGENVNWHLGFALAALGMGLGVTQFLLGSR